MTFRPKSAKFVKALCKNNNNKPSQDVSFTENKLAEVGEFPFHVAIGYPSFPDNITEYRCGGSLIADDVILTVAHCVYRTTTVTVKLGRVCTHNINAFNLRIFSIFILLYLDFPCT